MICHTIIYTTDWGDINEVLCQNINSQICHCRGPIYGQWKLLSWFSDVLNTIVFNESKLAGKMIDWLSRLSRQNNVKQKIHHKERPLMSVGTFKVSFIDIQPCHNHVICGRIQMTPEFFCVEVKQTKNWNEMYSLLQIYGEKIEKEHEKLRKNNRWLQLSWRANRTNFSRLLPDTILEKIQKSKNEFSKTTCVALEKKLRKKLKLFSTS